MAENKDEKRFVGFEYDKRLFRKLEHLKRELGQNFSSLVREGLVMLFDRYSSQLSSMDKD